MQPACCKSEDGRTGFLIRAAPFVVFFAGLLFLLPGVSRETGITGQDEYWLSFRTPMEMLGRGEWLTPWLNGEPRLKKPPLVYWAILTTYKAFGVSLLSARIWGVLAGAGLATMTCLIHRTLFRRSGLLAGLIVLSSLGVVIDGRRAMLDLPLAFFVALAVWLSLQWGRSGKWTWLFGAALALGLAFMTKGPVGWMFYAASAIAALACFRRWRFAIERWHLLLACGAIALAVALWWPLTMMKMWPQFLSTLQGDAGARRLGSLAAPFSAFGGSLGLVAPWSFVLLAALFVAARNFRALDRPRAWLIVWYLLSILPFFFMKSFERYMQPILPAQCILCAAWLEDSVGSIRTILLRVTAVATALVALVFSAFFLWFKIAVPLAVMCLALVAIVIALSFSRRCAEKLAFTVGLVWLGLIGFLYPCLGVNALPPLLEEKIGTSPVASYGSSQPSMLSMRLGRSVTSIGRGKDADTESLRKIGGFVFMTESDVAAFESAAKKGRFSYEKAGEFGTFFSRAAWLKFARKDATSADWKEAFRTRSLEKLKTRIVCFRVPAPESA